MTRHTAALLLAAAFLPATSSAPLAINGTVPGRIGSALGQHVAAGAGPTGCDATSKSFDYLLLVEQWPKAFGEQGPDDNQFTLHGLWPSRDGATDTDSYPCTCTAEVLNTALLTTLMPDMEMYWPSMNGANEPFWSHEWTKHGTCSGLAQFKFFETTLEARRKFDAGAALNSAGIKPGTSNTHDAYTAALSKAYGQAPFLACNTADNSIKEVRWCLTKDASAVATCTHTVDAEDNCNTAKPVLYPASAPAPAPQPAPGPPTPPATTCVPDSHGPPCTAAADCTGISGCVRCAGSGFCTTDPADPAAARAGAFSLW